MDDLLQEMIDPAPEPGDRPRRRRLVATIAIIGLAVVGIASLTTGAIFTDRESTSDSFTTGTVDLNLAGPVAFNVPASGMAPGDAFAAPVQVENAGSLELRYAVTYTATRNDPALPSGTTDTRDDLRDFVSLEAWSVAGAGDCSATPTGTQLSTQAQLSSTADTALIGDKAQGNQTGDRVLGAGQGGNEWLCFVIRMDPNAGNTLQNTGANVALDFYAEQTAHN